MSIRTSPWPSGMPCWTDLMTPDVAAAKDFYAGVLGWSYQDTESQYGGYAIATAGVGPVQDGARAAWTLLHRERRRGHDGCGRQRAGRHRSHAG